MPSDSGYANPRRRDFNFTGQGQQFIVPAGVTEVFIEAWGASSGDTGHVAHGGYVASYQNVSAGETLNVQVGGNNGYNGGAGTVDHLGGGASDIRQGGSLLADRVIVAGGAGGPTQYQVG